MNDLYKKQSQTLGEMNKLFKKQSKLYLFDDIKLSFNCLSICI